MLYLLRIFEFQVNRIDRVIAQDMEEYFKTRIAVLYD